MMIKFFKTSLAMVIGVALLAAMFSGCAGGTARSPEQSDNQQLGQNMGQQGLDRNALPGGDMQNDQNDMLGVNPGDNQGMNQGANRLNQKMQGQQRTPNQEKAEQIKSQLRSMREVQDANVIVMGNTCLVGFKPSTQAKDVNAAKKMITSKVKEMDQSITNVTVSEKSDTMNRMNTLGNDITSNRSMDDIANDFNQIIRGINPAAQ